jgi:hypothetical protein
MYCNVMVPQLQFERGISSFFRFHRGHQFASSALMQPITDAFVRAFEKFVAKGGIYYHRFAKGERKDDIALARLARWGCKEGVRLRRLGAGEDARLPDGSSPRREDRQALSLDRAVDGDGEALLRLLLR